jgi:hypothetical protein
MIKNPKPLLHRGTLLHSYPPSVPKLEEGKNKNICYATIKSRRFVKIKSGLKANEKQTRGRVSVVELSKRRRFYNGSTAS